MDVDTEQATKIKQAAKIRKFKKEHKEKNRPTNISKATKKLKDGLTSVGGKIDGKIQKMKEEKAQAQAKAKELEGIRKVAYDEELKKATAKEAKKQARQDAKEPNKKKDDGVLGVLGGIGERMGAVGGLLAEETPLVTEKGRKKDTTKHPTLEELLSG